MFWAITPLQNAIFATTQVANSRSLPSSRSIGLDSSTVGLATANISVGRSSEVLSFDQSSSFELHNFLDQANGITWLNETLPAFTTKEFAVAPFAPLNEQSSGLVNETWTAATILYETDLACEAAEIRANWPGATQLSITGQGYNFSVYNMLAALQQVNSSDGVYQGFCGPDAEHFEPTTPPGSESYVTGDQVYCWPMNGSFTFLAVWNTRPVVGLDDQFSADGLLASFCTPSYYAQPANVTVYQRNQSIHSVVREDRRSYLDRTKFNTTSFEIMLMGNTVDQENRVRNLGYDLLGSIATTVGIGLGLTNYPANELGKANFENALQSAHKLLFMLAASNQMAQTSKEVPTQLYSSAIVEAVVIVRPFAIVVECLLGALAVISLTLLVLSKQRANHLKSDPATIAALMGLLAGPASKELLHSLVEHDLSDFCTLESTYGQTRLHLSRQNANGEPADIGLYPVISAPLGISSPSRRHDPQIRRSITSRSARPFELSLPIGFAVIAFFVALIVTGLVLKITVGRRDGESLVSVILRLLILPGLTQPSDSRIVQQLLFNYLPVALATIIEPVWILLNRLFAILMPYEDLRRGRASFNASIGADYVSLPPQLTFIRAFKAHHYLLSSIGIVALLANPLAVAISGLFRNNIVAQNTQFDMQQPYAPVLLDKEINYLWQPAGGSYFDHFYVADANLTRHVSLPPWTSAEFFFLPFHAPKTFPGEATTRTAVTHGFGVDVPCSAAMSGAKTPIPATSAQWPFSARLNFEIDSMSNANVSTSQQGADGRNFSCYPRFNLYDESGDGSYINMLTADPAYVSFSYSNSIFDLAHHSNTSSTLTYAAELAVGLDSGVPYYNPDFHPTEMQRDLCGPSFMAGWFRGDILVQPDPDPSNPLNSSLVSHEHLILTCYPTLKVGMFEVTVDNNDRILSYLQVGQYASNTSAFFEGQAPQIINDTSAWLNPDFSTGQPTWHQGAIANDWLNYLIKVKTNSTDLTDPTKTLPDPQLASTRVEEIYRLLFSIILGLNTQVLAPAPAGNDTIIGTVPVLTSRWIISEAAFIVAMTILSLDVIVAIAVYIWRPPRFLPRMPTSIASQLAYFASSSILGDVGQLQVKGLSPKEIRRELERKDDTYGYGEFIGTDHKAHQGIEKWPFYAPMKKP